jgi:hypothetical protein
MAQTVIPPRQPVVDRGAPTLVPGGGRQRRWSLALLAVLLTVGSALAFVVLWLNAGERHPVLAVARPVEAGTPLTADDIKVVRISTDPGITPLSSSLRDEVIGQPAAVDLLPGSLLVPDSVGTGEVLDDNTQVVAIPINSSRVPDLERGDHVTVFRTDTAGGGQASVMEIGEARVMGVEDAEGGQVSVEISVDVDAVPEIFADPNFDNISIVKS